MWQLYLVLLEWQGLYEIAHPRILYVPKIVLLFQAHFLCVHIFHSKDEILRRYNQRSFLQVLRIIPFLAVFVIDDFPTRRLQIRQKLLAALVPPCSLCFAQHTMKRHSQIRCLCMSGLLRLLIYTQPPLDRACHQSSRRSYRQALCPTVRPMSRLPRRLQNPQLS